MKWNRLFYGPKTRLLVGRDWMSGNWGTFDLVICAVCTEPAYQVDAMVFVPCCWCRECIIIRIDIGQNGTQIWRERARNYPSLNMCVALCNWKLYALLRNQNKMFHLDGTRVPFTSFKKIQSSVFNEGLLEYHQLTCTHQMANIRANGEKNGSNGNGNKKHPPLQMTTWIQIFAILCFTANARIFLNVLT